MDIRRRIELVRTCMKALNRGIWRTSISLSTKLRLYNVYILPVLLYKADTWSMTVASKRRLDAFDHWFLRYILHVPFTAHFTNQEVRSRTGQTPGTSLVKSRRLQLFGHNTRAEPAQDHARALRASISRLPEDWRRPRGRPRQSWLRTVEADLKPLNFGLHTACRRAADRSAWRNVEETAMLLDGRAIP